MNRHARNFSALAILFGLLAWLARLAYGEAAFEASLRYRIPELENGREIHALILKDIQARQAAAPPWAVELTRLLREAAEREANPTSSKEPTQPQR